MDLGPIELPVALTVGDPNTAEPVPLGSVHLALRADGDLLDVSGRDAVAHRLIPVDPDDLAHQLAALLDRHAATLRAPDPAEEVTTGAAAHR